ncbi:major facilitator superfamily transporter [Gluconacetobacter sacchari DSM 12717]|uniref:MFS transporter n=2 Tax=Gluconacetobacter sacchari TaxID=92759 RepID=A0A7W4NRJ6_9PROT|nr:MFS transporter [Gluconacetobacter sacchari]MBB2161053.1 MFS transporter [Gluconacetobacter sacchari]GBQ26420.1 major facilitator superfamily transporter [Gluconacetobacter sacchari DSM 12717]
MIAAACIGNLLEWYDFSVYALFAPYIARALLPPTDHLSQLAQSLLVFALGAVARPLGALLLGQFADRRGRGPALMLTCLLMGAGTALILCDPPYAVAGRASIVILCLARLLQGISAGGEIGGAASFLVERAGKGRAGFAGSFLQATMGLSNMLGAAVAAGLTALLTDAQMAQWGWRAPFAIGLLIIPFGLILRRGESAPPRTTVDHAPILHDLAHNHAGRFMAALGLSLLWGAAPYALVIYLPLYAQRFSGVTPHASYVASLAGNLALVAGSLAAGAIADRLGVRRMLVVATMMLIALPAPILGMLKSHPDTPTMIAVAASLCGLVALFVGAAPLGIASLFPSRIRATGIALSYNAAVALFGGFAPALLASLGLAWHGVPSAALYVALAALPALAALLSPPFARAHNAENPVGHAKKSIPEPGGRNGTLRTATRDERPS